MDGAVVAVRSFLFFLVRKWVVFVAVNVHHDVTMLRAVLLGFRVGLGFNSIYFGKKKNTWYQVLR
jgi:hypothetical protein